MTNYLTYKENDNIYFTSNLNNYITFIGPLNDKIYNNLIHLTPNNYITLNYTQITNKNLHKLYNNIKVSSYNYINLFEGETVKDELAFNLESNATPIKEMNSKIKEISTLFNLDRVLNESPYSLDESKKTLLLLASSLITNPKVLIIYNLLDLLNKSDLERVINILNDYKKKDNIILNFTTNIEESIYSDELIITNNEKIVMSGKMLSVLNEEKIMKRLGISLPFIIELNKYLMDYNLIDTYILDYTKLGEKLWK